MTGDVDKVVTQKETFVRLCNMKAVRANQAFLL